MLKEPIDYSNYYYEKLKSELNVTNINLNKLGFIGFFIDLLANTQYDVKFYYDYLFTESFPITAREDQNLYYHAQVYGYEPKLASPSILNAQIRFNSDGILNNLTKVKKREIVIEDIKFSFDDIEFLMMSKYKLYVNYKSDGVYDTILEYTNDNEYKKQALKFSNLYVPLVGVKQVNVQKYNYQIPIYPYGSYYILDIPLDDYLSDITLEVKERYSDEFILFRKSISKLNIKANDNVYFYKILADNILRLEFGSGINGKYIPESSINILITLTKGEKGNIGSILNFNKFKSYKITYLDYGFDNQLIDYYDVEIDNVISEIKIKNSEGGVDADSGIIFKNNLLDYIQTRNNLISELDYKKILKKRFPNSDILFKKVNIVENIIYVYNYLLNRFKQPYYTTTQSILKTEFIKNLLLPEFLINGKSFISPFYFEYNSKLNSYDGYIFRDELIVYPNLFPISNNLNQTLRSEYFNINNTYLYVIYINGKTRFILKNDYINETHITVIKCTTLGINTRFEKYYDYDGFIKDPSNIIITIITPNYEFTFYFYDVQNVFYCNEYLRLKEYRSIKNDVYIVNVPLIDKMMYITNKRDINVMFLSMFDILKNNRMISDDVQVRFCNTYFVPKNIVSKITKQKHDIDINLPFKLKLELHLDKSKLIVNSIIPENYVSDIKLEVAKFVNENINGINLIYYNSKIVDCCHNFEYVKFCKVFLYDFKNNLIPEGVEVINREEFINSLTKEEFLNYSSIYWWIDINNIETIIKLI